MPKIVANVDAMASKGLRSTKLSTDTKLDAGEKLRKPLKPLLAIACVELNPYGIAPFKNNTNLSSRKPL